MRLLFSRRRRGPAPISASSGDRFVGSQVLPFTSSGDDCPPTCASPDTLDGGTLLCTGRVPRWLTSSMRRVDLVDHTDGAAGTTPGLRPPPATGHPPPEVPECGPQPMCHSALTQQHSVLSLRHRLPKEAVQDAALRLRRRRSRYVPVLPSVAGTLLDVASASHALSLLSVLPFVLDLQISAPWAEEDDILVSGPVQASRPVQSEQPTPMTTTQSRPSCAVNGCKAEGE
ncbi:hypothetical protein Purlil1_14322 [Purpureocillium lilacinum]|uniref:Uncharacterized protein n=1 Tax=Purpureocillium lilacinum TaxID=33203 RepID=A0ABR0BBM6_PURLI|nr:hypothetical protein Purlil1_14322 [Purpureocillium lilacinum]